MAEGSEHCPRLSSAVLSRCTLPASSTTSVTGICRSTQGWSIQMAFRSNRSRTWQPTISHEATMRLVRATFNDRDVVAVAKKIGSQREAAEASADNQHPHMQYALFLDSYFAASWPLRCRLLVTKHGADVQHTSSTSQRGNRIGRIVPDVCA